MNGREEKVGRLIKYSHHTGRIPSSSLYLPFYHRVLVVRLDLRAADLLFSSISSFQSSAKVFVSEGEEATRTTRVFYSLESRRLMPIDNLSINKKRVPFDDIMSFQPLTLSMTELNYSHQIPPQPKNRKYKKNIKQHKLKYDSE